GGGSAVVASWAVGDGVVELAGPGGGLARGVHAGAVAVAYVLGEVGGWGVAGAPDVQDGAAGGVGDQAPPGASGGQGAGGDGIDRAVPDELAGLLARPEQGGQRDQDAHVGAHRGLRVARTRGAHTRGARTRCACIRGARTRGVSVGGGV